MASPPEVAAARVPRALVLGVLTPGNFRPPMRYSGYSHRGTSFRRGCCRVPCLRVLCRSYIGGSAVRFYGVTWTPIDIAHVGGVAGSARVAGATTSSSQAACRTRPGTGLGAGGAPKWPPGWGRLALARHWSGMALAWHGTWARLARAAGAQRTLEPARIWGAGRTLLLGLAVSLAVAGLTCEFRQLARSKHGRSGRVGPVRIITRPKFRTSESPGSLPVAGARPGVAHRPRHLPRVAATSRLGPERAPFLGLPSATAVLARTETHGLALLFPA
jgi:hypothetical protein